MLHMTLLLADTTIIATVGDQQTWHVQVADNVTGKCEFAIWTNEQFATIVALALGVGEDKAKGFVTDDLYAVAEPLLKGWQPEVRPIP